MYIPDAVQNILSHLRTYGYSAHLVGGCIRDYFLSRSQIDYDIATSATPQEVMQIFPKTIPTGIKHGTVTVIDSGVSYEITTYRIDKDYDGRWPQLVQFSSSIEADLSRRDFTMNAIAYDGVDYVDPFGGISDISCKTIRAVGLAHERFREDALRMLRAVRFAAQLGFTIEESTKTAIRNQASLIKNISSERIRDELEKIILSDRSTFGLGLLDELGLLSHMFPDADCLSSENFDQTSALVGACNNVRFVRLAAIFYYCSDPQNQLEKLKYDRKTVQTVSQLITWAHIRLPSLIEIEIKKFIALVGMDNIHLLLDLLDAVAQIETNPYYTNETVKQIQEQTTLISDNKDPISILDLDINGDDLLSVGLSEGPIIGEILFQLLNIVLEYPEHNDKNYLIKYVTTHYPIAKNS